MELGTIDSLDAICWTPNGEKRPRFSKWDVSTNGIIIADVGLIKRAKAVAYYCRNSNVFIIKYNQNSNTKKC